MVRCYPFLNPFAVNTHDYLRREGTPNQSDNPATPAVTSSLPRGGCDSFCLGGYQQPRALDVLGTCGASAVLPAIADCSAVILRCLYAGLKMKSAVSHLVLRGYPPVRTRPVARGLICSALDRFPLDGGCHFPYSLGSLCGGQSCSGCPHLPSVVTRLPCFFPSGSSVGLPVHSLPRITKSSTSMEATWLTAESKEEWRGWFFTTPPHAGWGCTDGVSPIRHIKLGRVALPRLSALLGIWTLMSVLAGLLNPSRHLKSVGGSSSRGGNRLPTCRLRVVFQTQPPFFFYCQIECQRCCPKERLLRVAGLFHFVGDITAAVAPL